MAWFFQNETLEENLLITKQIDRVKFKICQQIISFKIYNATLENILYEKTKDKRFYIKAAKYNISMKNKHNMLY